jgi:hypothetical protein
VAQNVVGGGDVEPHVHLGAAEQEILAAHLVFLAVALEGDRLVLGAVKILGLEGRKVIKRLLHPRLEVVEGLFVIGP